MAISADSLLKLPEGALYRRSDGRAHVEASRKGGIIYISGTCDSLQRWVEYYEEMYHTARDSLEQREQELRQEREKKTPGSPTSLLTAVMMAGYAAGAAMTIIITKEKILKK